MKEDEAVTAQHMAAVCQSLGQETRKPAVLTPVILNQNKTLTIQPLPGKECKGLNKELINF